MEIGEYHVGVELNTDRNRIIEEDHNMITIIEVTLAEEVLVECKIIKVKISEADIEVTVEMKILEEVEVGLEKVSIQSTLEEMIKAVVDQVQV